MINEFYNKKLGIKMSHVYIVFHPNNNIVLPKIGKVKLVIKNEYTEQEIIEYCKRIYNEEIFIFANPFAVVSNEESVTLAACS